MQADKQVQKTESKALAQRSPVNNLTRVLLNSMHQKNQLEISKALLPFQHQNGTANYVSLLSIPLIDRVPGLALHYGEEKVHALLAIMLTEFVNFFNLKEDRTMKATQITACAYDMMLSTREDFLSIEDFAMFFSQAKKGQYGKLYEGIDQLKIFDMLEQYRQARWEALQRHREEVAANHKSMGPSERTNQPDELTEHLSNLGEKMRRLKEQVREQRQVNRENHFSKKMDQL